MAGHSLVDTRLPARGRQERRQTDFLTECDHLFDILRIDKVVGREDAEVGRIVRNETQSRIPVVDLGQCAGVPRCNQGNPPVPKSVDDFRRRIVTSVVEYTVHDIRVRLGLYAFHSFCKKAGRRCRREWRSRRSGANATLVIRVPPTCDDTTPRLTMSRVLTRTILLRVMY